MYKVKGSKTSTGNYTVAATCPEGHTLYKKSGDTSSTYKCPYDTCGKTVD